MNPNPAPPERVRDAPGRHWMLISRASFMVAFVALFIVGLVAGRPTDDPHTSVLFAAIALAAAEVACRLVRGRIPERIVLVLALGWGTVALAAAWALGSLLGSRLHRAEPVHMATVFCVASSDRGIGA